MAKPSVKQHLAAIRMLFDWLVTGQVLATNPAHAVRGPKHVVKRGKTPVLTSEQARELLDSIDTSTLIVLRDRALIGVMTYAFARIGAVIAMRIDDYFANGKRWWVRLHEKGGKQHEMPAHHKLEAFLDEYLEAAGMGDASKTPIFRAALGRAGTLSPRGMNRIDAYRMVQRRALNAGLPVLIGCHTFRATGITAYLEVGGSLENAQAMAAHESPRTTKLYDRTGDEITLEEVERIRHLGLNRISKTSGPLCTDVENGASARRCDMLQGLDRGKREHKRRKPIRWRRTDRTHHPGLQTPDRTERFARPIPPSKRPPTNTELATVNRFLTQSCVLRERHRS